MKPCLSRARHALAFVALIALALSFSACKRGPLSTGEYVYVSAPQANLRDRVAAVYNRVGTVKNGDRLEVLERQKRFVKVRSDRKEEGWIEQRYLVTEDIFRQFEQLRKDNDKLPSQGNGLTRAELNMHVSPGRDTEKLYQLAEGEKVEILKRGVAERVNKNAPKPAAKPKPLEAAKAGVAAAKQGGASGQPPTAQSPADEEPKLYDDFWLVRSKQGNVGWVLARMIDLDIPLEIAQYAEGQRIQGAFVLNQVQDEDKQVPQYLVLYSEPRDGAPFDFNQARVFSWNARKHRYETAYRERNFMGSFPVKTGTENFDKEGMLPTFTLRAQAEGGQTVERKYKMNGPIVRRVLAPGEQPAKIAQPEKREKTKSARKGKVARKRR